MKMDRLSLTIPGKPNYFVGTRLFIGSVAAEAGFDVEKCEDIKNALGEACKIVSCHGQEGYSEKYTIECEVSAGEIRITVKDQCDEHKVEKVNKPCTRCPQEGDLSIFIIRSLMDDINFGKSSDGYKFITMVKRNDSEKG